MDEVISFEDGEKMLASLYREPKVNPILAKALHSHKTSMKGKYQKPFDVGDLATLEAILVRHRNDEVRAEFKAMGVGHERNVPQPAQLKP